jgi:cell division protein FtsQ
MHRRRWLLAGVLVALGASSPLWVAPLLRPAPWFRVQRVEVSGTRLLAPHTVLAASGIRGEQSVWDDPAGWERALRAHPTIAGAEVSRRLPGTLRVRVEEKRPVAYVEHGALRPATAAGELLPLDPTRTPVDLPIVRGAWADSASGATVRRLLAEAGRLAQLDPGLVAEISELRVSESDPRLMIAQHRIAEIVLPAGLGSDRLAQLRAVLQELSRRGVASPDASPARPARVDLRFQDQIVVRIPSTA